MGEKNWTSQLTSLKAGLANPIYTKRYPGLAQLSSTVASPLLGAGGCSEKRSCPPAPYNNAIRNNAAVNCTWNSGMKAFGGHQLVAGGAVALPLETEFPASRFTMQSNGNINGSAADVGFTMADPMASHCWKLRNDSDLRAWLETPTAMANVGTPGWQRRWPCKTDNSALKTDAAVTPATPDQLLCASLDYCSTPTCPNSTIQMSGSERGLMGNSSGEQQLRTGVRAVMQAVEAFGPITNPSITGLHLSFQYTCCYSKGELAAIAQALETVKWAPVEVTFTRVVCAASEFVALADPVAQGQLFGIVSAFEEAMAAAGIPVHRFRASQVSAPEHTRTRNLVFQGIF